MSLRTFSRRNAMAALTLSLIAALPAAGQSVPAPAVSAADPRAAIAAKFPEVRPEQIAPSPVPGLYEVRIGAKIAYVSADGRYLVQGDIIDIDTDQNLTESRRDGVRRDVLAGVSEAGMIVFAPAKPTSTITVFTDIDCGYCRKLHKQIADYNARGIKVRYMFFPRSGPGTESWTKAEQVVCAKDRQAALTRAKMGVTTNEKACKPNPVAQHYNIGRDFGVQGTPAIILESGELIGGYLDPAELSKYISETKVASR
jgi:thiol:disulfide interchange protein DsbC